MSYRRLPGRKRGFYSQCTLWLGADHLLAVDSTGYSESYKRFYFKDIQALIARKSARGTVWSAIWGGLAGVTAALVLATTNGHPTAPSIIVGGGLCAIFLAVLLINVLRGPTCICHIRMPLVVHELPSLRRLKQVHKVLEELRPLLRRYQGVIPEDEIRARLGGLTAGTATLASERPPAAAGAPRPFPQPDYRGTVHWLFFGLLLADVPLTYLLYYGNNLALSLANLVSGIALFVLAVMALGRPRAASVPVMAKVASWVALGNLVASLLVGYAYLIYFSFEHHRVGTFQSQWANLSTMAKIKPFEHPLMAKAYACYMVIAAICSIAGLVSMAMRPRTSGMASTAVVRDAFAGVPGVRRP